MITIEPSSTITFQDFLNYNWIPNPNPTDTGLFTGFGYNPTDEHDYNIIKSSNPAQVWTLLKDGNTETDYHVYSGFFEPSTDIICYILTNEPAQQGNIKVLQPV